MMGGSALDGEHDLPPALNANTSHTAPMPIPDSTTRFSKRVSDYVRYRPRYPASVLSLLTQKIKLSPSWAIADVGSGTGISSELFLGNGNVVFGVEPNGAMRAAAEAALGDNPLFHSVDGQAEATGMPDQSVDLVVAAQAFHWFDASAARREFLRILRPPMHTILLWNRRRITDTPFLRAYEALLLRFGIDYAEVRHDHVSERRVGAFFGGSVGCATLYSEQQLDREGLVGRVRSCSYVPGPDHSEYGPMLDALHALFDEYEVDESVRLSYDVEVYYGRLQ